VPWTSIGPGKNILLLLMLATVPISRTNAYAQTGLMVYFNIQTKKWNQLHTHSHNHHNRYLLNMKFASLKHAILYILQQPSVISTAANDCSSLKVDWIFSLTTWDRTPNNIPLRWLDLAIFCLTCPDLAADQSLHSNTYKSHRYTSWIKQYKAQCYN
jgi:hypothetical protein